MPVVDAHHHVWDLAAHDQPWLASDAQLAPLLRNFTIADLAAEAAAREVTATVLVQTVSEPCETPEMLALAASGGLVAEIVGWSTWSPLTSPARPPSCGICPVARTGRPARTRS